MNLKASSAWLTFRRLLRYSRPHRWWLGVGALFILGVACLDALLAWGIKPLVDHGLRHAQIRDLTWLPGAIVGIFFLRGLLGLGGDYCVNRAGRQVVMAIRQAVFQALLDVPVPRVGARSEAEWVSTMIYHVDQVATGATDGILNLFKYGSMVAALFLVVLGLSWQLAVLFVFFTPLMLSLLDALSRRQRQTSHRVQDAVGGIAHGVQEVLRGLLVWRVYGRQDYWRDHFSAIQERYTQASLQWVIATGGSSACMQTLVAVPLAASVYLAVYRPDLLSVGAFVAIAAAVGRMMQPIKAMIRTNADIQKGLAAAQDIFELLDLPAEVDQGRVDVPAFQSFQLCHVSYQFPGQKTLTLRALDLTVERGQLVAIVGRSGAGKSTLLNLLLRFDAPHAGRIEWNGEPMDAFALSAWRDQFAVVSQATVVSRDTIAHNIALSTCVDEERLMRATAQAHAHDFIMALPEGYDTQIGDGARTLSGGQLQRIALARALYRDRDVLILDEATSALDALASQGIAEAILELRGQKTIIMVAHHSQLIEYADQIYVMQHGELVESGQHEVLLARQGAYAELVSGV